MLQTMLTTAMHRHYECLMWMFHHQECNQQLPWTTAPKLTSINFVKPCSVMTNYGQPTLNPNSTMVNQPLTTVSQPLILDKNPTNHPILVLTFHCPQGWAQEMGGIRAQKETCQQQMKLQSNWLVKCWLSGCLRLVNWLVIWLVYWFVDRLIRLRKIHLVFIEKFNQLDLFARYHLFTGVWLVFG